jgi:hypothetical protein
MLPVIVSGVANDAIVIIGVAEERRRSPRAATGTPPMWLSTVGVKLHREVSSQLKLSCSRTCWPARPAVSHGRRAKRPMRVFMVMRERDWVDDGG